VAVATLHGPAAGLELAGAVAATGALDDYHLLHAVRGDLLTRLGREPEARAAFTRAAALTANSAEQGLLLGRARSQQGRRTQPMQVQACRGSKTPPTAQKRET
jgi:predicted RNA polymerase sigma factor